MNELNDSGKEQLLGLLKEKGINITKDELDEKLNKLNDEDLEKICVG